MQHAIERVRGFYDVDATTHRKRARVLHALARTYQLAGFDLIDVPVVEHMELYVRKNGSQVLSKLYAFQDQGRRDVALRPEFTASVIRSLAPLMGAASDRLRVAYQGPVFRYEKPQRATMRQFTQSGVEYLGEAGSFADADMVALACKAAAAAGVANIRLVLGHLGPLRALLAHLHVDATAEAFLLEHLEYYGRGAAQRQFVRARLGLVDDPNEPQSPDDVMPVTWPALLEGLSPEAAREVVTGLLAQMGVDLSGNTRTPDEIVERVLLKVQRQTAMRSGAHRQNIERALEFCASLAEIRGTPETVLGDANALLRSYEVPGSALDDLRSVVESLDEHDLGATAIVIAPGMARGISYYSGLIFELYSDAAGGNADQTGDLQLCGGGRYDTLPQALTGRHSFPALGFAFGVERVMHAVLRDASDAQTERVCVCSVGAYPRRHAVAVTEALRSAGLTTVLQHSDSHAVRQVERLFRDGFSIAVLLSVDNGAPGVTEIKVIAAPGFVNSRAISDVRGVVNRPWAEFPVRTTHHDASNANA